MRKVDQPVCQRKFLVPMTGGDVERLATAPFQRSGFCRCRPHREPRCGPSRPAGLAWAALPMTRKVGASPLGVSLCRADGHPHRHSDRGHRRLPWHSRTPGTLGHCHCRGAVALCQAQPLVSAGAGAGAIGPGRRHQRILVSCKLQHSSRTRASTPSLARVASVRSPNASTALVASAVTNSTRPSTMLRHPVRARSGLGSSPR